MATSAAAGVLRRTASMVVCKPATGSHVLRVNGYSHLSRLLGNGDSVRSSPFNVAGHAWSLMLYPNGQGDGGAESGPHVAVFLYLVGRDPAGQHVRAHPKFSLLDHVGKPAIAVDLGLSTILKEGGGWGMWRFISREALEESGCIKDDCFSVLCDVTVTSVECHDD